MNDRIKELAKQAGFYADKYGHCKSHLGDSPSEADDIVDLEEFAKLIALKCASFAYKSGGVTNKSEKAVMEANRIYHKINEYFGIEE